MKIKKKITSVSKLQSSMCVMTPSMWPPRIFIHYKLHIWVSARKRKLQCVSNEVSSFLHQPIETQMRWFSHIYKLYAILPTTQVLLPVVNYFGAIMLHTARSKSNTNQIWYSQRKWFKPHNSYRRGTWHVLPERVRCPLERKCSTAPFTAMD